MCHLLLGNMWELNERDTKILTKSFLKTLNDQVNENKDRSIESTEIFKATELRGFAVPTQQFSGLLFSNYLPIHNFVIHV